MSAEADATRDVHFAFAICKGNYCIWGGEWACVLWKPSNFGSCERHSAVTHSEHSEHSLICTHCSHHDLIGPLWIARRVRTHNIYYIIYVWYCRGAVPKSMHTQWSYKYSTVKYCSVPSKLTFYSCIVFVTLCAVCFLAVLQACVWRRTGLHTSLEPQLLYTTTGRLRLSLKVAKAKLTSVQRL